MDYNRAKTEAFVTWLLENWDNGDSKPRENCGEFDEAAFRKKWLAEEYERVRKERMQKTLVGGGSK